MNYFCHALPCLGRPLAVAGTLLPDWLSVLGRERRIRPWHLPATVGDGRFGDLVRGVARHFEDDAWFHVTPAFRSTTAGLARMIREATPPRTRAGFYAHVLTEILLDAHVARARPEARRTLEADLSAIDPAEVERMATDLVPVRPTGLAALIERFRSANVLDAYADDRVVAERLTMLGRRVRQPAFPGPEIVSLARTNVRARTDDLLNGEAPR